MKTMNKAFIGALTLLLSNFAFANDKLDGSISVGFYTVWDIFMKAPFGFILFIAILFFFGKRFSK